MNAEERNMSEQPTQGRQERLPYLPPAIIYNGKITIRAGSPVDPSPQFGEGPPSPFDISGN